MSSKKFVSFAGMLGALFAVLTVSFVAPSCVTTEANRRALIIVPEGQMNAMGEGAFSEILQKEKVSNDPAMNEVLTRVASRIAKASGKNYDWEFKLIDEPKTVNAFCLPGGKVAVYTGILPIAKNEAGLAAIIGHEVAHATLKHGAERISQGLVAQAGLTVAGLSLRDAKYRDLILGGLGLGAQFGILMPYGRKQESEADFVGLTYMAKAGYDPSEAVELWKRMGEAGGGGPPEFLSTHPDPSSRAKALSEELAEVRDEYAKSEQQPSKPLPI